MATAAENAQRRPEETAKPKGNVQPYKDGIHITTTATAPSTQAAAVRGDAKAQLLHQLLHSLPGFAIDLHCSSVAWLRNNNANGKAIRFTVTTSIASVFIILLLPHG